jgi:saccharopine dehydrogenase-like NADP-dependent oxidoreductase
MKVLVLGGAGDMARDALDELRMEPAEPVVTVADINLDRATQEASMRGPRFSAQAVNVEDHDRLVGLMKEHDITLGFAGPFYHFEKRLARAALTQENRTSPLRMTMRPISRSSPLTIRPGGRVYAS